LNSIEIKSIEKVFTVLPVPNCPIGLPFCPYAILSLQFCPLPFILSGHRYTFSTTSSIKIYVDDPTSCDQRWRGLHVCLSSSVLICLSLDNHPLV